MLIGRFKASQTRYGFFGRRGGVSQGIYASLNCSYASGDDRASVDENRRRALGALGLAPEILCMNYQVHGVAVTVVQDRSAPPARADALITDRPDIALGVLTADCAPVLFSGRKEDGSPVIGAAHAGWKGALGGVLENTIAAMEGIGAVRGAITAMIGPCIGPDSYEVQPDFLAPFLNDDPASSRFFQPDGDAWRFDLPAFVQSRLERARISATGSGADTYQLGDDYFSYRRATHRGDPEYGRQLAVVTAAWKTGQ